MKQQPGFLLIELIIGIAIAAIISLLLTNTLFQTNRQRARIDDYIQVYSNAAIVQHQLERDLNTAFAPHMQIITPLQNADVQTDTTNTSTTEKDTPQKESTPLSDEKKKPLTKIFYGVNKGENIDILTCITTSPLQTYWSSQSGSAKAHIARIIYRLTPDTHYPNAYILSRQEGQNLDFDSYKPDQNSQARTYTLIKNIKKCVITYEIGIEKEPAQPTDSATQSDTQSDTKTDQSSEQKIKKPEIEYKLFTEWNQEDTPNDTKPITHDDQPPLPRIPHTVTVDLVLWNHEHTQETSFKFIYTIIWKDTQNKKTNTINTQKMALKSSRSRTHKRTSLLASNKKKSRYPYKKQQTKRYKHT